MSDKTYVYIRRDPGVTTFTMPAGFSSNVEIHTWGAGGGTGYPGTYGGGGGYAKAITTISSGDTVIIQVGRFGLNGGRSEGALGGSDTTYVSFRGGNTGTAGPTHAGDDNFFGAGGGGGEASYVSVNGNVVCCGAGGGGGGGGVSYQSGYPGLAGGTYDNLNSLTRGGDSNNGYAVGGGGGGGYPYGGAAGISVGDDAGRSGAGNGGQNYGNVTLAGSGTSAGGRSVSYYPTGAAFANAGQNGYIVLVLERVSQMLIKDTTWKNIDDIYYKIGESRPSVVPTTAYYASVGDNKILKTTVESSSYKVPPGVTTLQIDMIAHGGNASGNDDFGSPGGGSGGYYQGYNYAVTPGEVINYTVGGSGSNTVFGILTCTPGQDGSRGSIGLPGALGGSPNGTQGEGGGTPSTGARGGKGADSPFGTGGAGGVGGGPGQTGASGASATGYGAGGGGGGNNKGGGAGSPAFISITPVGLITDQFKVPAGVFSVTVSYATPTGLQTHVQAVTPGSIIPTSVGDYGQESKFGSFTMPAYSKQVFRYRGNVDHILQLNVQVATSSGDAVTNSGYNSAQTAAAAAAGITYGVTYEGWHGDLYSTIDFTPVRTSTVLNNIRLVGTKNSGRNSGPSISAQPTAGNSYVAGLGGWLVYDPSSGEDTYDITLTLQQQGYFTISYDLPVILTGWRKITQVWVKEGNEWKAMVSRNTLPS